MTWNQVAEEVGGFTPAMLTGLARARHVGLPRVMRLLGWLDWPAADFVVLRVLRSLLAAYLSAHRTMINGSALCAALAVTEGD